jgi:hypothetical protein
LGSANIDLFAKNTTVLLKIFIYGKTVK